MDENQPITPQDAPQDTPQNGSENNNGGQQIDFTPYVMDNGQANTEAITELIKAKQAAETSRNFYHGKYSQLVGGEIPKTIDEYGVGFKADSSFEKFMDTDKAKEDLQALKEFCLQNKLPNSTYNLFAEKYFKDNIASGVFDARSEIEKKAEEQEELKKQAEEVQPMLTSLGRTLEENSAALDAFFNSNNVFTNNSEMKDWIVKNVAENGSMGYMVATLMQQVTEHSGIPSVKTANASSMVDKAALEDALQKESDPNRREAMIREWHEKNGITIQ